MERIWLIPVLASVLILGGIGVYQEASAMSVLNAPAQVTGTSTVPVLDNSFGNLDLALNFGGADLSRDGISFTGVLSPLGNSIVLANSPFTVTMNSIGPNAGGLFDATVGTDALFETEIFATGQLPLTQQLVIDGLQVNRTYQFQFIHGDTRTGSFID